MSGWIDVASPQLQLQRLKMVPESPKMLNHECWVTGDWESVGFWVGYCTTPSTRTVASSFADYDYSLTVRVLVSYHCLLVLSTILRQNPRQDGAVRLTEGIIISHRLYGDFNSRFQGLRATRSVGHLRPQPALSPARCYINTREQASSTAKPRENAGIVLLRES